MERARRRRRVPAFGEWNYYYYSGRELSTPAAAAAEWYAPAETDARSEAWFRYPSPPRKPPPAGRKVRRPETADKPYYGGGKRRRGRHRDATPARSSDAGAPAAARTPAKAATARARVVRPVDADLYQVPPPDFAVPTRRKGARSMWMGCFGLNCVA